MSSVWYGQGVADDGEFRLCGDVAGKRVLELGVSRPPAGRVPNAVVFAAAGAKTICVDPASAHIADLRAAADRAEVRVECHTSEVAELGFVTSGSVDLVLAAQSLDHVDDLPRLLRQVHRVLRPGAALVASLTHPVAAIFDAPNSAPVRPYGASVRSVSELFMSLDRSNFRLDAVHELLPVAARDAFVPTVLLLRARKQGV